MISLISFVPYFCLAQETEYQPPQVSPVVWVCYFAFIILMIAGMWKVFSKAGQPGWAAIIPIYNMIVLCQVAGRPIWWFLLLMICFPIFYFIVCLDIAKRFGKGAGFAIGMFFLGFIFFPILGFGSAQYQGGPPSIPTA